MPDAPAQRSVGGGPLRSIADDPARTDAERALAEQLISWMRQRQALHARRDARLDGVGLSFAQIKLLFHLPLDDSVTVGSFAASAGLTPATATQALDALEREGVVERCRSERDRRVVDVRLTELGHSLLETVRRGFRARWDEHVAELPASDLEAAARVLARVTNLFQPPPATSS
jgi:DNA-binding MarR family transcriptional regulator